MPYTAEISRANPTCFMFLIDQSGSMADRFGGSEMPGQKAEGLARAINAILQNLVLTCAKEEGVRDYFHIGVVGYGASVGPALSGPLSGREIVTISEVGTNPARVDEVTKKIEDGAGGLLERKVKFPIWFDPVANGGTPMCHAFGQAEGILRGWVSRHPDCYPPVVINITDGESTDGDPSTAMRTLTQISSSDGTVLLFNLHLSSSSAASIVFPSSPDGLPDQYARMLFDSASPLTPAMLVVAREQGLNPSEGARGFVLNGSLVEIIQGLQIGTRPSNLR